MIKSFSLLLLVSVAVFSCTGTADDKKNKEESTNLPNTAEGKNEELIYLSSANGIFDMLCQEWVMAEDTGSLEGMTEDSKFEIPYRSYYLSADGSFIKNPRNELDYGSWRFDEATQTLTFNSTAGGEKKTYKIVSVNARELVLAMTGTGGSENLKFIAPGLRFKNESEEPFSLESNRWRIRPKQSETDSAVHRRLKDNLRFFILYYKSALAKDEKTVSFWGLPSCFKWYGGGIYLKKEGELKQNWIGCFYNREQAMQAYQIASRLLDENYQWPKDEQNWLKQNLAVLEQMYQKIDEIR